MFRHPSRDHHRCHGKGQPAGGTGSVHPYQGNLKRSHPKTAGYGLAKQVSRKKISDLPTFHAGFSDGKLQRFLLQRALRLLPGIAPEFIVRSHHVKAVSKGSFPFFGSHHRSTASYINRHRYFNAMLTLLKNCPNCCIHKNLQMIYFLLSFLIWIFLFISNFLPARPGL